MRILLVAATKAEIQPALDFLETHPNKEQVEIAITGIGGMHTAYALSQALQPNQSKIDFAINAGIAGTYRKDWALGKVVQVVSDIQGDLGFEEQDGSFRDFTENGLLQPNDFPYENNRLYLPKAQIGNFLPVAHGLSVNKVHGCESSIQAITNKYPFADIETMEGAAFFYAALQYHKHHNEFRFLALRSLSNYVEPRDRSRWQIPLAIAELNNILIEILSALL